MSSSRTRRTALVAATAAVILSGCGAGDSQTAATVGDREVSMASVDRLARAICEREERQYEETGQSLAMERLRQTALNTLTIEAVAEQVAEEYDVRPGAAYGRARAGYEAEAESLGLSEEVREAYVDGSSVDALLEDVFLGVGRSLLAEEGVTEASEQQAAERGIDVVRTWPERYDLEVNPVFDVRVEDGMLRPAGGASRVGVAVSETATSAAATAEDPSLASGLPDHLRCG
ncbi:SurA N-terminal domain-containing protein [Nocardioides solisilvae]|uniref:SurA N-terminal domain-containing protein n=1 Tax=Nocardioides solisilvae TaxID=1542435 RepID=UPI000D74D663|nr:SurA N-terminal domain-containing protein [Nocardioides solisilvae]